MNQMIIYGCVGGLLPELLRLISNKEKGMPDFYRSITFYLGLAAQIGLGGFVVHLMTPDSTLNAVLVGFSAPSILTTLASKFEPPQPPTKALGSTTREFSLLGWWK